MCVRMFAYLRRGGPSIYLYVFVSLCVYFFGWCLLFSIRSRVRSFESFNNSWHVVIGTKIPLWYRHTYIIINIQFASLFSTLRAGNS